MCLHTSKNLKNHKKPATGKIPAAGFSDLSAKSSEYFLNLFVSS
jgi:hypothetical protein